MKYICILVICLIIRPCYAQSYTTTMRNIGYREVEQIESTYDVQKEHDLIGPLDIVATQDLSFLTLGENGLSLGGMTGLIEFPTAFIISKNYCNSGINYVNSRGFFTTIQGVFESRKNTYLTYVNYGISDGLEIGLNHFEARNDIDNVFDNNDYNIKMSYNTINLKLSMPYRGVAVAFGGQYTPLTDKDQILVDFNDAEKMNNFYFAISSRLTRKFYGHLLGKSTFIRGATTSAFTSEKTSFFTTGIGFEYKQNRNIAIFSEMKKLYGDYIQSDSDTAINIGTRYNNNKFGFDVSLLNIANDSTNIYSYGFNYTF